MDITAFYQTFFDEADELLADMEQHLLELDPEEPDIEQLNAIFRAAHSIKGGAGTFGFNILQETTHLLENLLDGARRHEMRLSTDIINLFLETKDIMQDQLDAYKSAQDPDHASFEYICQALRQLALEAQDVSGSATAENPPLKAVTEENADADQNTNNDGAQASTLPDGCISLSLCGLKPQEVALMLEELGNLGTVREHTETAHGLDAVLETTASEDDIAAVLCFVLEPEQIAFNHTLPEKAENTVSQPAAPTAEAQPKTATTPELKLVQEPATPRTEAPKRTAKATESTSIRVAVEKVDQLINLVGELVITQSMLAQRSDMLDPVDHGDLLNSLGQLERNARDLQESVMSIRMMPMEYVFSRFPRQVRDLAGKLNKQVEITLLGSSTELDKSLIERIIDPLTHLVRNSLDHGIETPEVRVAAGKSPVGNLTLSAEHQGGNIYIEVIDDGAGLNRERILAKARSQGMAVSDTMTDDEVGLLIFAPGFWARRGYGRRETKYSGNGRPR